MKKVILYAFICTMLLTGCTIKTDINNKTNNIDKGSIVSTEENNISKKSDESINKLNLNKKDYINELNKLKSELEASFNKRYASPVTLELRQAAAEEYKLWDDKLNEVYNIIVEKLIKQEKDSLIAEEIDWIKIRDEKSKAAGKANEGGSIAPLNEVMSLIETTRERCYELVNEYMK